MRGTRTNGDFLCWNRLPVAEALPALTREAVMRADGSIVNTCSSTALVEVLRYLKRSFWPFPWQSPLHPNETPGSLGDGGFQGAALVGSCLIILFYCKGVSIVVSIDLLLLEQRQARYSVERSL